MTAQLRPAYDPASIFTHLAANGSGREPPWGSFKGAITVAGNGPSLRDAEIRGPVAALNGAFPVLLKRGVKPKFAICCDSQAENAAFYDKAPKGPMYLMASRCHPSVFSALNDRNVRTWHVSDAPEWTAFDHGRFINGGATVGLKALNVLHGLGFSHFDLVGYDSCFSGEGRHHAGDQPWNDRDMLVTIRVGERTFLTTPWMIEQCEQAKEQFRHASYTVSVKGDGLLAAIWKGQHQ